MSEQQQIPQEQFVINQTIQNLAQENANQAVQIANLQARLQFHERLAEQNAAKSAPPGPPAEALPGEQPVELEPDKKEVEH